MTEWLEIGKIVAPQGLKGELRVLSFSDFPERFEQPGKRWLQAPDTKQIQEVELLEGHYIPGKNLYVVKIAGIGEREQAETLRGYKMLVPTSARPHLEADEYHVSDLINLEVYNQLTGENIGVVTDILWGGNDLLEVKLHQPVTGEKSLVTVLIPFVKEIVPVVDLERKKIEINPPLGLLDLK